VLWQNNWNLGLWQLVILRSYKTVKLCALNKRINIDNDNIIIQQKKNKKGKLTNKFIPPRHTTFKTYYFGGTKMTKINKDRLIIGIQAGGIATAFKELGGLISLWIGAEHTYWDYAAVLLLGRHAKTPGEYAFAVIIQIIFSATLAAGYAYREDRFPTNYPLIKGGMFGGGIWLVIQTVILLFKIQPLQSHTLKGSVAEFVTAIVFGIVVSWWVDRKIK
jgi:hypothetical protein